MRKQDKAKMVNPTKEPIIYNITLTVADTEYSQALPSSTREFRVRCRTLFDVRYAWETGKVAAPAAPYATILSGLEYRGDNSDITGKSLFLASSEAGVIVEIEVWI